MPPPQPFLSGSPLKVAAILAACYLLGCFCTGYYLVRSRLGRDIRETGSGAAGARNAGRSLGWQGFVLTLAGDCAKGAFAVWAVRHFTGDQKLAGLAMLAVVAGHVWPLQLGLRGGKGASTALGALLAFDFTLTATMLAVLAVLYGLTRKTTASGLIAYALLPLAGLFFGRPAWEVATLAALSALVLVAHRTNLAEGAQRWADRPATVPRDEPSS
jgi:glycerol-3-phosphate acyltransferase PlsY